MLHVGDEHETDVPGARGAGPSADLLDLDGGTSAIRSLAEPPPHLGALTPPGGGGGGR